MEPVWLKYYPAGVPAETHISRFASLEHMLEQSCRRYAQHPAFTPMGAACAQAD